MYGIGNFEIKNVKNRQFKKPTKILGILLVSSV